MGGYVPQFNSPEYRENYDRIFGKRDRCKPGEHHYEGTLPGETCWRCSRCGCELAQDKVNPDE